MFSFRNNLVLIQEPGNMRNGTPTEILQKYETFLPNPVEITIFPTRELARENGYTAFKHNRSDIYNIIVYDSSGRQIWLKANIKEGFNIYKQTEISKILLKCGFRQEEASNFKMLRDWLGTTLRSRPAEPISIKKKSLEEPL